MISALLALILLILITLFIFRLFLYRTALIYLVKKWWHWMEDRIHPQQFYKVPQYNANYQENHLYSQVYAYLNSLSSIEDSDFTNLFSSGKKSNEIILSLDDNQIIHDTFLGARISWKYQKKVEDNNNNNNSYTLLLMIKKKDKKRILKTYLQHIRTFSEDSQRELNLYINSEPIGKQGSRWTTSVQFTHPACLETIVMDPDLKNRIKSDLEAFMKSKSYYHRLGRVWKRSYLLYGPSGTGKSSFVAAMAKFLSYDVYDLDLSRVTDDTDLKLLLVQTKRKSLIVVEDLDQFVKDKDNNCSLSFSGLLSFMDGIINSCSTDEKIMVFTMNSKELIDPVMLRPGRIDVHIYFPYCNFNSFKTLAETHLGVKDHKLFPQVEEIFHTGATLSPAEIGELMIMNRGSPSRALKSVITALQANCDARAAAAKNGRRLSEMASPSSGAESGLSGAGSVSWKDVGSPAVKEIRKLYGILKMKSSRRTVPFDVDSGLLER